VDGEHLTRPLLFLFIFAHCLADFGLQHDYFAKAKSWEFKRDDKSPPWWMFMAAHCMIHAGLVYLVSGVYWFAVIEFGAHYLIDFYKTAGRFNAVTDQCLHVVSKLCYMGLLYYR